jgi:hypothetical protein
VRRWKNAWAEFVPFLAIEVEVRRVIFSTNAVESLNARFRRAVRTRDHFPSDQAALKCLDLTLRSLDPTGRGSNDGPCAGSPPLTPSPSCSRAASSPTNKRIRPSYTLGSTLPRYGPDAAGVVRVDDVGEVFIRLDHPPTNPPLSHTCVRQRRPVELDGSAAVDEQASGLHRPPAPER